MRQILIYRPKRLECAASALKVEVNGKDVAKLKNNQRVVVDADDGAQEIRLHGGMLSGKSFQDKVTIPANNHNYQLRVDFLSVSSGSSSYIPMMRPCGDTQGKDDTRLITLLGATLFKLLMDEKVRQGLKALPGAYLRLLIEPAQWRLLLCLDGAAKELFHSEYSRATGGLTAALLNTIEHADLNSPEGRAKLCDKVLNDYVACLPDYERSGADGIVFKG